MRFYFKYICVCMRCCCCCCLFYFSTNIKIGSTWAQEMVWLLGNNLDYEGAKSVQVLRSPLLELTAIMYEDYTEWVK